MNSFGSLASIAVIALPFIAAVVAGMSLALERRRAAKARKAADFRSWCAAKDRQFADRMAHFRRVHNMA